MSETHLSDVRFDSLNLSPELLQGIEATGFTQCTPIQAETLPVVLAGHDLAGQAQTGTGKTAAFLIGVYQHLLNHPAPETRKPTQPLAVILAPTRELAIQIHKDAQAIGKFTHLKLGLVYGGAGYETQRQQLEAGVDILIGTPGRLIDYFKQDVFDLKALQAMVLDEADRMFDLGFIKDIRYLYRRMPPATERLNLLFSATLSHRVRELAYEHMNDPQSIEIAPDTVTAKKITECVYFPAKEEKIPLLLGLLKSHDVQRAVIFINTKRVAEKVSGYLKGNDYKVALLSGDVPQNKRTRLLKEFTDGDINLLVATDVAARGLHIPEVSHVFNFDLPQDVEDYVHRIGRTARAGASGEAISFACDEYVYSLPDIEEYIGHKIPVESINPELLVTPKPPVREEFTKKKHAKKKRHARGEGQPRDSQGERPRKKKHGGPRQQGEDGLPRGKKKHHRKKSSGKHRQPGREEAMKDNRPESKQADSTKPGLAKRLLGFIFGK